VIATDLAGRITYWNRFAERVYGWSAAEVLGRDVQNVTPSRVSHDQAADIMSRLQAGGSWSGEFPVQRRDGSDFLALVTDTPIHDRDGRLIHSRRQSGRPPRLADVIGTAQRSCT
jgi:PAS domain S-box-containing protein